MEKRTRIIIASMWGIIALILTILLIRGLKTDFNAFSININTIGRDNISSNVDMSSKDANTDYTILSNKYSNLDIELVNENLIVETWDKNTTEVTIVSSLDKDKRPKIIMDDNTLRIKTPRRNNIKLSKLNDSVTIKIPEYLAKNLNKIDIEIVSGKTKVSNINSLITHIDTVSGVVNLNNNEFSQLKINTVSGKVVVKDSTIEEIKAGSISGVIDVNGDITKNFELSSVSADLIVLTNTMPSLGGDFESVSGDVKAYIPENDGFTLNFETGSGDVENEFTNSKLKKDGENVYKNGNIEFDFETVSGDISISKI